MNVQSDDTRSRWVEWSSYTLRSYLHNYAELFTEKIMENKDLKQ